MQRFSVTCSGGFARLCAPLSAHSFHHDNTIAMIAPDDKIPKHFRNIFSSLSALGVISGEEKFLCHRLGVKNAGRWRGSERRRKDFMSRSQSRLPETLTATGLNWRENVLLGS